MASYIPTLMTTLDGEVYKIYIRRDVADYFSLDEADDATESKKVTRSSHSRTIYKQGLTAKGVTTTVKVKATDIFYEPGRRNKKLGGQTIKVPTEEYTNPVKVETANAKGATLKGALRFVSINIPQGARNIDIARWIRTKFTTRTPDYFITQAGARFSTLLTVPAPPAKK